MSNFQKYVEVFVNTLEVDPSVVETLEYQGIENWDSVGHMELIAALEDAFDIMMETDDIIDLSSFKKGKEILEQKYNISF